MNASEPAASAGLPRVFIGSSSEGVAIGRYLQHELDRTNTCVVTRWDQGVFQASTYTLDALSVEASRTDFAVLIATADDTIEKRGGSMNVARDNVIFEIGLFIGAIGRERTFIVADQTQKLQLPSDLNGLTWLPYSARPDNNERAAVNDAVIGVSESIRRLGPRLNAMSSGLVLSSHLDKLDAEIERVCLAARAQGWKVRTQSDTALRIQDPRGRRFTLSIGDRTEARKDLRRFAADLRANGLRISRSVRQPAT